MPTSELIATLNALGVTGLLAVAILGVLRGDWVPGRMYDELKRNFDALQRDHAALRDEFDAYRRAHP